MPDRGKRVGILGAVSRTIELLVGLMLLLVGVLVLASDWIREWITGLGISAEVLLGTERARRGEKVEGGLVLGAWEAVVIADG